MSLSLFLLLTLGFAVYSSRERAYALQLFIGNPLLWDKSLVCMVLRYWGEEKFYNMTIISLFSVGFVFGLWQQICFSSLVEHFLLHSDQTVRFQEAEVWVVPFPAGIWFSWRLLPWRAGICYGEVFEHISQRLPFLFCFVLFFSCHDLQGFFFDLHKDPWR